MPSPTSAARRAPSATLAASLPFSFPLVPRSAAPDGYQLLGNPTANALAWGDWPSTDLSSTVYVYDPSLPGYRAHNGTAGSLLDGAIPPFTAFWVRATADAPSLVAPPASASPARRASRGLVLRAEVHAAGRALAALWTLALDDRAAPGVDAYDGPWIDPPATTHVRLTSMSAGGDGPATPLVLDARPSVGADTVWVHLAVAGAGGAAAASDVAHVTWSGDGAGLALVDSGTGAEWDLAPSQAGGARVPIAGGTRLGVVRRAATARDAPPADALAVGLGPNPATGPVRAWAAQAGALVVVAVFDAVGRRLAHASARERAEIALDADALAPGVYTAVATATGTAGRRHREVRRFTVVR